MRISKSHDKKFRTTNLASYCILVVMILVASTCISIAWTHTRQAEQSQVRVFSRSSNWIAPDGEPAYSGYFRKKIHLASDVKSAWIMISAQDAFELSVNNDWVGAAHLWRPTRPFQNGLSERGQRITNEPSALALNYPREYQWTSHENWRVPAFFDITTRFKKGDNVIAIDVETRRAPASILIEGELILNTGERISIDSSLAWKARHVPGPLTEHKWFSIDYDDDHWKVAKQIEAPSGTMFSNLDSDIFKEPFQAEWLHASQPSNKTNVTFDSSFHLAGKYDRVWIRMATNRFFDMKINGFSVNVKTLTRDQLDAGAWVLNGRRDWTERTTPELLDPDAVGSFVVGSRFHKPPHGNPTLDDWQLSQQEYGAIDQELQVRRMTSNPDRHEHTETSAERRRWDWNPIYLPEKVVPVSLTRNRAVGEFLAYDITNLVQSGRNTIEVRYMRPLHVEDLGWQPRLAIDGGVKRISEDGAKLTGEPIAFESWHVTKAETDGSIERAIVCKSGLVDRTRLAGFPLLDYRGVAIGPSDPTMSWTTTMAGVAIALGTIAISLIGLAKGFLLIKGETSFNPKTTRSIIHEMVGVLFAFTVVIATTILVESSLSERHECLWFTQPLTWKLSFVVAFVFASLTLFVSLLGRLGLSKLRSRGHAVERVVRSLPRCSAWTCAICAVLLVCFFLRVYQLDFQPLDDDEYASTQAILAIAETGVPGFVPEEVWYTRSPFYHYFMGLIAFLFGSSLWSLKIPTALFGVATAWLTYHCGAKLLGNRWIGMSAMILISIHPFQIYTGHIIRFYQMQQFFALLTLYFFCRGFVTSQSQGYRYATIITFLAAVLSQEISAVLAFPLAIGYILFAKDLGWKQNARLIILTGAAMSWIVVDYLVFQTKCLTRVEGVSASLEAAVKPHFWFPYNHFSIYIGYSRLHILLSAFLFAGLPFIWRERNRNAIALHLMLLLGVVLTNLLVTHVSLRYQYWLIPLWLLLSIDGMRAVLMRVVSLAHHPMRHRNRHMWSMATTSFVIFVGIVISWSPWRIVNSYDIKILGDSTGAFRYVRAHRREGDALAATEPHTHAGFLEAGGIDYDISIPLLYDFAMLKDGVLIDRNGGARVVSSLDDIQAAMAHNDRLWILLNREKFRNRGKNLRWEYPGARVEHFIRSNCELKHRTYLWSVFLWDAEHGQFQNYRTDGL